MNTKDEVHAEVVAHLGEDLAEVWWTVPLPAFGGVPAEMLWASGQTQVVIDRVKQYNG